MDLDKRIRMAAESILENEALREGLEDEAASALMDWGIARAKQIVGSTARLEDDTDAEEAVYPRMRALRQMLLAITGLYGGKQDPDQRAQCLQELGSLVSLVYASETIPSSAANWDDFLRSQSGDTGQKINAFRALIEDQGSSPVSDEDNQTPTSQSY
jgi:hypothetical protein